jgi:acetylxylan esterase
MIRKRVNMLMVLPNILLALTAAAAAAAAASASLVPRIEPAISKLVAASHSTFLQERAEGCPDLHVFGIREAEATPGFGLTADVIGLILSEFPGSTAEPIIYPAEGATGKYGGSVTSGAQAVVSQTQAFSETCPNSTMVLIGYAMGAQVLDDVFCGGPDATAFGTSVMPEDVGKKVDALIWMGDPRFVGGLPYNVGTATAGGVSWPFHRSLTPVSV